jgi:hypothetical protein
MKSLQLATVITLLVATNARGVVTSTAFLESGTLPFSNQGALTLGVFQYIGCRFHLDQPVLVDHIGGGIGDAGFLDPTIFGAIAQLSSAAGFPDGHPSDFQPVAATTFKTLAVPGGGVGDELFPLGVILQPGDYALIFGSGRFGTAIFPALPAAGIQRGYTPTPQSSFFIGRFVTINNNFWDTDSDLHNFRFLVMGTAIPEPTTATLAVLSLLAIAVPRRRKSVPHNRA